MHTQRQPFTLLLLAIASLACLPGTTNAQELVGSTQADNTSPSRWAPYQAPLWQPLAPARVNVARVNVASVNVASANVVRANVASANILPLESSTPTASTRDNVRRQHVRTQIPVEAKLKQLELDYVELGSLMAADAVRADADYHRQPQLSELDVELERVANRVLSGVRITEAQNNRAEKIVVPDFTAFQSQLDATTAELSANVDDQLRASEQRVFELRHEPASGPATSTPTTNGAGRRVSQRPLKATLTVEEVQRLGEEFIAQQELTRLQQRLSPAALGRATQLGYLQYLQQMIQQDKQVLATLRAASVEWNEQLRSVVEMERAIAKKIDSLASTASTDENQPAPARYSLIRQAAGIAVRLE